jgi:exosortase A
MDVQHRTGSLARRTRSTGAAPAAVEDRPAGHSTLAAGWRRAAIAVGAASLVFGLAFFHDMQAAVTVWLQSTAYNHCFLILPLIGFLLWERRAVFSAVSPKPAFWPLVAMPLLSAVWLAAAILDLNEGRQLAVVAMFEIVLLATLGTRAARALLAPLLFLFFLVPSGAFLVPELQKITADIVVRGLHLLNIPVYSDGMMIAIPEGQFEIAEACAGLRFLIASIVFGCFFSVVMYRSYVRRALFVGLSLVVPVGANGLRALGIIVLAHIEGSAAAVEADHVLYGWLFFSLVIVLLIAIGVAFVDNNAVLPATRPSGAGPRSSWPFAAACGGAVVLALAGPAYAVRLDHQFRAATLPWTEPPAVSPPWRVAAGDGPVWRPMVNGADRELLQSFAAPGSGVVVRFVALYRLRAVGNALTNSDNRIVDDRTWQLAEQDRSKISYDGHTVSVTSSQIVSGPHRRLVWSFYLVDGRIAPGLIETKLLQARAVLLRRAALAAFVAIAASEDDPGHPAPEQLERFLQANRPLLSDLDALSRENAASNTTSRPN